MLALAGGNVITVLSVPASVRVLLTVRVLDVVPPATVNPTAAAASVRPLTVVGVRADAQAAVPPLTVRIWLVVPMARLAVVFVPLPTLRSPSARVATPVPPLVTGNCPVTPVESGKLVALVRLTDVGVPRMGVTSVGEVERATDPVPVEVPTPVPPLATGSGLESAVVTSVELSVTAPVRVLNVVTPPAEPFAAAVTRPLASTVILAFV